MSLETKFTTAMLDIYDSAKKLKPPYRAERFAQMVREHGGKGAAEILLATSNPSEGFTELFLRGKENLKLSVEYLVLKSPWNQLFDEGQLETARKRLRDVGCELPADNEPPAEV